MPFSFVFTGSPLFTNPQIHPIQTNPCFTNQWDFTFASIQQHVSLFRSRFFRMSRNAPPKERVGGELRDIPKNGCGRD